MGKFFCDALRNSVGLSELGITANNPLTKVCIDITINTFTDIFGVDGSSIARVDLYVCNKDENGNIIDLEFTASLISEEDDQHITIGKDWVTFIINTPIGKRKSLKMKGIINNANFEFKVDIDSKFYKRIAHSILITREDGARFKEAKKRSEYKTDYRYEEFFDTDIVDAKQFVAGKNKNNAGTKGAKTKERRNNYAYIST